MTGSTATPRMPMDAETKKNRISRPTIREASFDDYRQVRALESRYGLESKEFEAWMHLWSNNPALANTNRSWPIGWTLHTEGHIVGYVGNIPLMYEMDGEQLIAAATRAWVVDRKFRSYSVLLLQRYFSQPNVDVYIGTSANALSSPILGMFNSVPVPRGLWNESLFWVTNPPGFISSWLKIKGLPQFQPLRHALSAGFRLTRFISKHSPRNSSRTNLSFSDCFDERFDTFWHELRKQKSHLLLAVRTREVLDWHFKYSLLNNGVWILIATSGTNIIAYSIFCRQDNLGLGLTRMRLIDFQALDGNTALLVPMLSCAIERCHKECIHMLEYIGHTSELAELISPLRPYKRKLPSWLYYYKPGNDVLAAKLANSAVWSASGFDGDSSL